VFAGYDPCDPCLSALMTRYLSSRALYKSTYLYLLPLLSCTIYYFAKAELCDHCCLSVCHSVSRKTKTRERVYGCRHRMVGMGKDGYVEVIEFGVDPDTDVDLGLVFHFP